MQLSDNTTHLLLHFLMGQRKQLQKRTVREIRKESHTDPTFKELNLLKMNDIYRLQLLKCYFKYELYSLSKYFGI